MESQSVTLVKFKTNKIFFELTNPSTNEKEEFFYYCNEIGLITVNYKPNVASFIYENNSWQKELILKEYFNVQDKTVKLEFNLDFFNSKRNINLVLGRKTQKGWSVYVNGKREDKNFLSDLVISELKPNYDLKIDGLLVESNPVNEKEQWKKILFNLIENFFIEVKKWNKVSLINYILNWVNEWEKLKKWFKKEAERSEEIKKQIPIAIDNIEKFNAELKEKEITPLLERKPSESAVKKAFEKDDELRKQIPISLKNLEEVQKKYAPKKTLKDAFVDMKNWFNNLIK